MDTGIYQGTKTYLNELVAALARLDLVNDYYLFDSESNGARFSDASPNFIRQNTCSNSGVANFLYGFARVAKKHRIDIFQTNYFKPLWMPCRSVIVIHDILQTIMPQYFPFRLRMFQYLFQPYMVRQTDAVITVSNYTKTQLIEKYHINPDKIFVTPEAAAPICRRITSNLSNVSQRYGIDGKFVLYVGRLAPIKNIPVMLKAFAEFLRRNQKPVKFVLIGQKDPSFRETEIDRLVEDLNLSHSVIFHSNVPWEDLVAIYNLASVFLFMSQGEGFGLPILEAMACGTPVIASDSTACSEIAGDAAIKIPPHDVAGIAHALQLVLENCAVQRALSQKGIERAGEFTWEECARKTMKIYEYVSAQ